MNKVILLGRLVADPITIIRDNYQITNFTLAINRPYKNKETNETKADFIRCIAYNNTSRLISQYMSKGRLLSIVGEWHTGSYVNNEGRTIYTNECYVNEVHFIPSTSNNQNGQSEQPTYRSVLNSRVRNASTQPKQLPNQQPASSYQSNSDSNMIPQAFDADIDVSDEFPW